jgi:[protein-PII] uridylyltransferase
LAGLFHDIAKGRGGDHSVLGAEDAEQFCLQHGMNRKDTRVVSQLVRKHLLMSTTAQRKDISDPEIIHEFAREAGSEIMLDYLYLLTVADIRATNPKQWNNWKSALLRELYHSAKKVLRQGLEQPPDIEEIIKENRDAACDIIAQTIPDKDKIEAICDEFPEDYFLHHKADEVQWHVLSILDNPDLSPAVNIRQSSHSNSTEIFIHTCDTRHVFERVVGALSSMNLDILYADIYTTKDNQTLDTFIIQNSEGNPIQEENDIKIIRNNLLQAVACEAKPQVNITQHVPRILKSFNIQTNVVFTQDLLNHRTIMVLTSVDRPGLLYTIAKIIAEADLEVTHAKIATLGEQVEDIFYLTDENNRAVRDQDLLVTLKERIVEILDKDPEAE